MFCLHWSFCNCTTYVQDHRKSIFAHWTCMKHGSFQQLAAEWMIQLFPSKQCPPRSSSLKWGKILSAQSLRTFGVQRIVALVDVVACVVWCHTCGGFACSLSTDLIIHLPSSCIGVFAIAPLFPRIKGKVISPIGLAWSPTAFSSCLLSWWHIVSPVLNVFLCQAVWSEESLWVYHHFINERHKYDLLMCM